MTTDAVAPELMPGNRCLLTALGQHYMVVVKAVDDAHVRVTFPGVGYPPPGVPVALEYHVEEGFYAYASTVVQPPQAPGDPLVLQRPPEGLWRQHRRYLRVPTDLIIEVRAQGETAWTRAALLDIGVGGCLLESEALLEFGAVTELQIAFPGARIQIISGEIVHMAKMLERGHRGDHLYGVRFCSMDTATRADLDDFIGRQVRALYPASSNAAEGFGITH
jgi:hypothetical protein